MKSRDISVEAMARRSAKFSDLQPYQSQQQDASGIPLAVLEKIAARRVYPLMVPEGYTGRSAMAPIKGAPGLALSITESPPGDGASGVVRTPTKRAPGSPKTSAVSAYLTGLPPAGFPAFASSVEAVLALPRFPPPAKMPSPTPAAQPPPSPPRATR